MSNADKFRRLYESKLKAAIKRNPDEYFYGVERVPAVVLKMTISLKAGTASNSPQIKSVAKVLGIGQTLSAIKAYLNEDNAAK